MSVGRYSEPEYCKKGSDISESLSITYSNKTEQNKP